MEDNESSEEIPENHAKQNFSDDTDCSDDIIQVSQGSEGHEISAHSGLSGQLIEESSIIAVEEQPKMPDSIYRAYGDISKCKFCSKKGDKWEMIQHPQYCRAGDQLIKQNSEGR